MKDFQMKTNRLFSINNSQGWAWIIWLIICLAMETGCVNARVSLMPAIQNVQVQKASTDTFFVTIANAGDKKVTGSVFTVDLDIDENGRPIEVKQGYERGCSGWITLLPDKYELDPKKSLKISCVIKSPKDASGSYYTFVRTHITEGLPGQTEFKVPFNKDDVEKAAADITLESDAAVVVLLSIKNRENTAILKPDTLIIEANRQSKSKSGNPLTGRLENGWSIILPVTNVGNVHTQAKGRVSIWTQNARLLESTELLAGQGYVFPNRKRRFVAQGSNYIADGKYVVYLSLTTVEGKTIKKALPFYVVEGDAHAGEADLKTQQLINSLSPGFQLKSPLKELNVRGDGNFIAVIPILNVTQDTLCLTPTFTRWKILEDGSNILDTENNPDESSIKSWFKWDDSKLIIPPGKSENFKVYIQTPKTLGGGEYFAGLIFNREGGTVELPEFMKLERMELICLKNDKGLTQDVAIDSFKFKSINSDESLITNSVVNTGNSHCVVNAKFYLAKEVAFERFDPCGEPIELTEKDIWILPSGSRRLNFKLPVLAKGRYEGQIIVEYSDKKPAKSIIQRFQVK